MKNQNKIIIFLISFFIIVPHFVFSQNKTLQILKQQNIQQVTLENGLQIFLLENNSDALVHINIIFKAGFSNQTKETNGFFKLFTKIIQTSTPQITFSNAECLSDFSSYSLEITNEQLSKTLSTLSKTFFESVFSQETIQNELAKMKNEVNKNAKELSTLINSSIDSRVFSEEPWKHDSGIYSSLFSKNSVDSARTILTQISQRYYTPQNCAVFITGNFDSQKTISELSQTFGKYYSNYKTPVSKPTSISTQQRKYVFHHPEISEELTQIVVQYTLMSFEECELAAALLNNNFSSFKNEILSQTDLNIPGWEYIDVKAAHKKNISRLIIQSLMQKPEKNTSKKISSFDQTQLFLQQIEKLSSFVNDNELLNAKLNLQMQTQNIIKNPIDYMKKLSEFWAISPFLKTGENFLPADILSEKQEIINQIEIKNLKNFIDSESPFIFIIINSKDFKTNRKAFMQEGFEEINEKNASWYMQELAKETKNQYQIDDSKYFSKNQQNTNDNNYFEQNISQIQVTTLSNGIKVFSKKNQTEFSTVITLNINGGKLNTSQNNGFEEVMCNILSSLIQSELNRQTENGIILNSTKVTHQTDLSTSSIYIEFNKEDSFAVCNAIQKAIVFTEIPPAAADKAVFSRQYKKRLENGSAAKQMESSVIKSLYGNNAFYNIFETQNEILQDTNYFSILQAYPDFLDAKRYNIIVCGDFDQNIFDYLDDAFSYLSNSNVKLNTCNDLPNFSKNKTIKVKINHTFLTDIPAELAGPQPAVLVPTTEFKDPVIFAIQTPQSQDSKQSAIFNAVLNTFQKEFQTILNQNEKTKENTVNIEFPKTKLPFALITIMDVNAPKEVDSAYKTARNQFITKITSSSAGDFMQQIKNDWILSQMKETATNYGTSKLMQKGIENFPENPKADFYLQEYNYIQNATIEDYINAAKTLPITPQLRAYGQ